VGSFGETSKLEPISKSKQEEAPHKWTNTLIMKLKMELNKCRLCEE
jgi:hypothetical protein